MYGQLLFISLIKFFRACVFFDIQFLNIKPSEAKVFGEKKGGSFRGREKERLNKEKFGIKMRVNY